MNNPIKRHYHWVIAAMALLLLLVTGGANNNFANYHKVPVSEALGISHTAFSLAGSVQGLIGVFSMLITGPLIQRLGYRKTMTLGLLSSAAGYILFTFMKSYWMLVAGCVLLGLATGICATSGMSQLLNLWFHKYRGTVLGIVATATSLGSTALGVPQAYAIDNVSWRLSFAIVAGLMLVTALILYLLVRNNPESMGLRPLGWGQVTKTKTKKKVSQWTGFTMAQLKKSPAYYLLAGCAFLSIFMLTSTTLNLVPYFVENGLTNTDASALYGTMMLVLSLVKLLVGYLCDLISTKRMTLVCHIAAIGGLLMLLLLPKDNYVAMLGALLVLDFAMPITTLIFPLLSVELFGYQAQNQFIGLIMAMVSAASIFTGTAASAIFNIRQSYGPVIMISIGFACLMLVIYPILFALVKRQRKKLEAAES